MYSDSLDRTHKFKMATNVRRVLVCIAAILLISDCGMTVNADDNNGTTVGPTTVKPTTAPPTTAKPTTLVGTTNKGSTGPVTVTTEKDVTATMGTNTDATMTTIFSTTEMVTDMTTLTTQKVTTKKMTTEAPITPSPRNWIITDDSDKVCMKIQFGASFFIGEDVIFMPTNGTTDASTCSDDKSVFNLKDSKENGTFSLTLVFERDDDTYEMTQISFTVTDVTSTRINTYYGDRSKEYFTAPVGNFYTCEKVLREAFGDVETVTLTLSNQKYQPFAKKSGGDYGKAFNCGDKLPEDHGPRVGLIVSMTLLALLVIAGCGFFVYRRKKSSYQRFNNGV
ncbi:hypothetical protein HOLleu_27408 [Holothuria leucospilota]|uniref:Lysosome-associated membrane glycoprotein 5 n=1 Tax=Holothuria leucospilota TaxID=206669 RepID=A0A9Q1H376_HOLLE|nr:hypothetical protein HOLleu_27408 [Holothuria leucospilota]